MLLVNIKVVSLNYTDLCDDKLHIHISSLHEEIKLLLLYVTHIIYQNSVQNIHRGFQYKINLQFICVSDFTYYVNKANTWSRIGVSKELGKGMFWLKKQVEIFTDAKTESLFLLVTCFIYLNTFLKVLYDNMLNPVSFMASYLEQSGVKLQNSTRLVGTQKLLNITYEVML